MIKFSLTNLSILFKYINLTHQAKQRLEKSNCTDTIEQLKSSLNKDVTSLLPIYHTVAVQFACLHDSPERMLAKHCINGIVPWRNSRSFLYARLRRNLYEHKWIRCIEESIGSPSAYEKAKIILKSCFMAENDKVKVYFLSM